MVCHIPVLRIFPSTRKRPWSTWHARRSRASGLGGSPCQRKGGSERCQRWGGLHSLPLCLQIITADRSLPELSVSLEVTHSLSSHLCGKLPSPGSPSGLCLPSSHGARRAAPAAVGAAGSLQSKRLCCPVAFPSWPAHRSASCPSPGFGSCLDLSAE